MPQASSDWPPDSVHPDSACPGDVRPDSLRLLVPALDACDPEVTVPAPATGSSPRTPRVLP